MPSLTYFVVQPFSDAGRGRVAPGEPRRVHSRREAERIVESLRGGLAGAVAFSRTGDPVEGDWADAELIAQNGVVPLEYLESSLPW
ncbi:hypothetical protein [Methylobacterium sp. D54C]